LTSLFKGHAKLSSSKGKTTRSIKNSLGPTQRMITMRELVFR
jgi:hypothetical protein